MDKRVREILRFFVAPRVRPRVSRTLLSRNTSTSVVYTCNKMKKEFKPFFKLKPFSIESAPRFVEDTKNNDLLSASLRLKDIAALFSLAECEVSRLRLLKIKRQRKKRGGVISQEVNLRAAIKVRVNKSFRSRKELTRRLSKGDDDDVGFNSCNASEDGGGIGGSESTHSSRGELIPPKQEL